MIILDASTNERAMIVLTAVPHLQDGSPLIVSSLIFVHNAVRLISPNSSNSRVEMILPFSSRQPLNHYNL